MTYLGFVFTFVFGGNVLFQYGVGACSSSECKNLRQGLAGVLTLSFSSLIAAALHSVVMKYLLYPFGLEALEPLAYVLAVALILYALAALLAGSQNPGLVEAGRLAKSQVLSCVVYSAALSASRGNFTFSQAAAAGFAAALGWWCASVLLDRIVERLELEDIPQSLSGLPLRFLSAGLMAMAFSGIDRLLVSRIVG